ncbi:MAG: HAD family hydrolase [Candidatus Aenigmarchaeota archaeon]
MFRLVVFDLDGTLIDSAGAIMKSINVTFSEIGLGPYEWERDIVRFFGKPFEEWAKTLLKEAGKYSGGNVERISNKMWDNYAKIGVKHAKLMPGTLEALEALKKRGIKLAVATNMRSRHAKVFFSHFGLGKYFEKVCTVSDVGKGKPHPEQLERIMKDTGFERNETLMVGDSKSDLEFARNSGVKLALLDSRWNKGLKPDYRIKKLKELPEII